MTVETDLIAVLEGCCRRVFAGVAPVATQQPYVTWQHVGGRGLRYVDGTAADKRWPEVQISVWAATPSKAFALIGQIEEAMCTAPAFAAQAMSEPIATFDDMDTAAGYLQTFTLLGDR